MIRAGSPGRRSAVAVAALAVVAGALSACGTPRTGGIGVTGDEVDTHRAVTAGQTVRITAGGTVDFGGGVAGIGALKLTADGDDGATPPGAPAPQLRRNSLLVRIGEVYYQGGVDTTFVTASTGDIVLRMNAAAPPPVSTGWDVALDVRDPAGTDDGGTAGAPPAAFDALPISGDPIRTDVYVDAGSTVRLTSAGVVDFGRAPGNDESPRANAEGNDGTAPSTYPAPNLRPNSLIAQVEGSPTWYQGGSDATFVPATSGPLILAANDDDVADNTQSWYVTGHLTAPPTDPATPVAFGPFMVSNTPVGTGLTVPPGRTVHVEARGLMNLGGSQSGTGDVIDGADGDGPDSRTPPDYPAPDLRLNSLLVKIGPTFTQGGTSVDITGRRTGPVTLLPNDVHPEDNRPVLNGGVRGWSVTLTLR